MNLPPDVALVLIVAAICSIIAFWWGRQYQYLQDKKFMDQQKENIKFQPTRTIYGKSYKPELFRKIISARLKRDKRITVITKDVHKMILQVAKDLKVKPDKIKSESLSNDSFQLTLDES